MSAQLRWARESLEFVVRCMDLTSLEETDKPESISRLCALGVRPDPDDPTLPSVAAVCVYPPLVPVAREALEGTGIRVAAAAGAFPDGRATVPERVREIRRALALGAEEIDTVLDHGAFLTEREDEAREGLAASREACGEATMKVILETGELGSAEPIRRAATLAIDAGADFIKSSTGKVGTGATHEAALAMMEAVRDHHERTGRRIGVKVSGGIRLADQALEYMGMLDEILGNEWMTPGLFRIGASSLLDDVTARLRGQS